MLKVTLFSSELAEGIICFIFQLYRQDELERMKLDDLLQCQSRLNNNAVCNYLDLNCFSVPRDALGYILQNLYCL